MLSPLFQWGKNPIADCSFRVGANFLRMNHLFPTRNARNHKFEIASQNIGTIDATAGFSPSSHEEKRNVETRYFGGDSPVTRVGGRNAGARGRSRRRWRTYGWRTWRALWR